MPVWIFQLMDDVNQYKMKEKKKDKYPSNKNLNEYFN